jgi:hypothetical protein
MCNLQCEQLNLTYMLLNPPSDLLNYLAGFGTYKDLTPEQKAHKSALRKERNSNARLVNLMKVGAQTRTRKRYAKKEQPIPKDQLFDLAWKRIINTEVGKKVAITAAKKELAYSNEIDLAFDCALDEGYLRKVRVGMREWFVRTEKQE